MAMISVECPDCGRVLMRLPATGGTNQTKMCTGCKNRFRVIKDARTGSIRSARLQSSAWLQGCCLARSPLAAPLAGAQGL